MCAINPVHKKRFILDVYSANPKKQENDFLKEAIESALQIEISLNTNTSLRWHLKETKQQAD